MSFCSNRSFCPFLVHLHGINTRHGDGEVLAAPSSDAVAPAPSAATSVAAAAATTTAPSLLRRTL